MKRKLNIIFKRKDITILFFGQIISLLGSGINMIGLSLYVLKFDNPILGMGTLSIVMALPWAFLSPFTGVLADKFSKKKIMIFCDILRGILGIALFFTNNIFLFYAITLAMSIINVIFAPAVSGFIPFIVEKDELDDINSIYAGNRELAFLIGPAIGGLLVSLFGPSIVFIINGISFILSGVSEIFLTVDGYIENKDTNQIKVFENMKQGYLYIQKNIDIKFIILFFGTIALSFGSFRILIPNHIVNQLGISDSGYGMFVTVTGVGSTIGALLIPRLLKYFKVLELMIWGVISYGILYFIFIFMKSVGIALFLYFLTGFSVVLINVCSEIYLQKNVDKEYIGRVISLNMTFSNITLLLSMFLVTSFGQYFSNISILIGFIILLIVAGAIGMTILKKINSSKNINEKF
ncbi:MAG: MFS transporter [Sarcina sp.]